MNILLFRQDYLTAGELRLLHEQLGTSLYFALSHADALRMGRENRMDCIVVEIRDREDTDFMRKLSKLATRSRFILTGSCEVNAFSRDSAWRIFQGHPDIDLLIQAIRDDSNHNQPRSETS